MSDYQAIVIGAGPGGYPCAIRLGQLGLKTLCVEKEYWGGVCLNVGCIPSKALINAGKRYEEIQHAGDLGFEIDGTVSINWDKLMSWKGAVVDKLTGGVKTLLKANNVEQAFGTARIIAPGKVEIVSEEGTKVVTADNIIVATGSRPIEIPGFAYADERVLDSTKALALKEIPGKLVVIGGGYIGLEMGSMFNKLGSEVTVVEMQDQILPGFDTDCVKLLARRLKKAGVNTLLKTKANGWEATDNGIIVNVENDKDGKIAIEADYVLVTVGRFPNSESVGLKELGAEMDGRFFKVNKKLETSIPGIYAIGDVAGGMMLAHKATHEGEICAEVIAGHNVQCDYKTVPAVVFTDPEIATAGMSESEAKAAGHEVKIGKVPWGAIGKAIANGETDGFVKCIIDAKTELVLGYTIIGYHASDIISEAGLAIEMSAEALDVGLTIHPHPTLGEALMEAAKHARGEAIHVINR